MNSYCTQESVAEFWYVPLVRWVKLNYDGAFKANTKEAAIGIVVRDNDGKLIDGLDACVVAFIVVMTEAKVVNEGLKLVSEKKFPKDVVEMDTAIVYHAISVGMREHVSLYGL
ncbi:hypothetical protein REPUB_Repub07fG0240000 [Reevesia pubescens]